MAADSLLGSGKAISDETATRLARMCTFLAIGLTAVLSACNPPCRNCESKTRDTSSNVAIADLNGDGAPDLAVVFSRIGEGTYPNPIVAAVILQNPSAVGTFQTSVDTSVDNGSNGITSLAIANVDNVNGPDMVISNSYAGNISTLLQGASGAGRMQAPVNLTLGGAPLDVAVADLNNDGAVDLVVADGSSNPAVRVLYQNAGMPGQFLTPVTIASGLSSRAIAIGDVNGDGRVDVVVAEDLVAGSPQVVVFYHDPSDSNTFLPGIKYAIGTQASAVKIYDLNGDGLADLAVLTSRGTEVFLQDPTHFGAFLAPTVYASGITGQGFAIGDLNRDGHPDIAVGNVNSVAVLLQDSSRPGVFLAATQYSGASEIHVRGIDVGDLNGDGLIDIAVADGERAKILFNITSRPGTFSAPVVVGR